MNEAQSANGGNDRDGRGQFLPGNPGGPGRPHTATARLRAWLRHRDGDEAGFPRIAQDVLAEANAGKPAAIRMILDNCPDDEAAYE